MRPLIDVLIVLIFFYFFYTLKKEIISITFLFNLNLKLKDIARWLVLIANSIFQYI